jgi:hypothetical protein
MRPGSAFLSGKCHVAKAGTLANAAGAAAATAPEARVARSVFFLSPSFVCTSGRPGGLKRV